MTDIFYPKTSLFPKQPQILHQMVLQFFLMSDHYEEGFPKENVSRAVIMPYGSYFNTGVTQAGGYRFLLGHHKPKRVVIVSFAELEDNISILGCDYKALHTFFGELPVNSAYYKAIKANINDELFSEHADPIICQLPFLRSYQKIDEIVPIIVNTKKTDLDRKRFWSALSDKSGETCYVICTNSLVDHIVVATHGYEAATGELFLSFETDHRTS